ncbi:Svf1p Ecym_1320 [Eremothecium cymbalariae DBVPG|uniref:Survival factor 1 n=1 Tax=Eremothecium cymbalariae (strain CBS 270.75 / DBVPG 7215 / KCTC 17166 / NRRL Y-17582) TaxID=931890 RepID=G8JN91_ERECY|nr:hypothetical protein Ecym_1320 [Eremothecium cymbalariae DBVPG\
MLKWIQGGISSVTGIAEPQYGKEYIHTATDRVKGKQPFHETSIQDFKWQNPASTNVETFTFYFTQLESGVTGFAQIIHSTIGSLHTTGQFTFRCHHKTRPDLNVWTSTKLENFRIDGTNFYANNLSLELSSDGTSFHLKSSVCTDSIVDLVATRLTSGVKVGEDPTTYYGEDEKSPWGTMRHVFWPRNSVNGTITLKGGVAVSFKENYSMLAMAMQGMKPHHAARSWNFLNFHSEEYSVILMEFTTPKSYENTEVSIGILCDKNSVLAVTVDNKVEHLDASVDSVGWPVPKAISIDFQGVSASITDNEIDTAPKISANMEGQLSCLVERVDVMAEIPNFVKNIVSGVAGAKPYIYQFVNELNFTFEGVKHKGLGWCEVTFISEFDDISRK